MPAFERYLSVWVALAILAGLGLGQVVPGLVNFLASLEYGSVNFVVAVLIWFMVYPMMVAVDFSSLARIHERPKGLVITLAVNWLIKPFTMAALGLLFFELIFAPFIEPGTAGQYIAGMILLGAAPCTAMVFVWSHADQGRSELHAGAGVIERRDHGLCLRPHRGAAAGGDRHLRAVGDAGAVGRALRGDPADRRDHHAGRMTRRAANPGEAEAAVDAFTGRVKPLSVLGLLATVVLLFGFQGEVILTSRW